MAAALLRQSKFLTLSFSGAGHLLPYHLGVAAAIRDNGRPIAAPIEAVSGSSSGAIAAALFAYFPNRIEEYAEQFITDGGRAINHFEGMAEESDRASGGDGIEPKTNLHIAATRCSDGAPHLFGFPTSSLSHTNHLLNCLKASCKIPKSFHPMDVLPSETPSIYPDEDGVSIYGIAYVDGGIASPAPSVNLDTMDGVCRVVISPISGGNAGSNTIRVSPEDDSWKFPYDLKCRGEFHVHPSVQNIKAMQMAAGVASPSMLREWYERGIEDGARVFTT